MEDLKDIRIDLHCHPFSHVGNMTKKNILTAVNEKKKPGID